MPQKRKSQILNGQFPLSYLGVIPVSPTNFLIEARPPTGTDAQNVFIGDVWLDDTSYPVPPKAENIWVLVSLANGVATWVHLGAGGIVSLTGNVGGPVFPDGADNINTIGDNIGITVVGNPGTNTLTWSLVGGGIAAQSFQTDDGLVEVPNAAGRLFVFGGNTAPNVYTNINTRRGVNVNTVDVDLNNSIGQPNTNTAATQGMYALGAANNFVLDRFMYNYGTNNTFLGNLSGNLALTVANATNNTCLGFAAGNALVGAAGGQGAFNVIAGSNSGALLTNGSANVFAGNLSGSALLAGNFNVFAGQSTGTNYVAAESSDIVIGANNIGRVGENNTIRIGTIGSAAGTNNIFIGRDTGTSAYTVAMATDNTFIGSAAGGAALTIGTQNTIIGSLAGNGGLTTALGNTLLGYQAGSAYAVASGANTVIGTSNVGKNGEFNIIRIGTVGFGAGDEHIFIGHDAGNTTYTGGAGNAQFNQGLGTAVFLHITTGGANTALGNSVLSSCSTGDDNVGTGYTCLLNLTSGSQCTSSGSGSLANTTTGSRNTAFGYFAGTNYTGAESDNICLGIAPGVNGESSVLRIGLATNVAPGANRLSQAFINGIRGITTAVNDAIPVLIDSASQLGTVSSSERYKDNIEDMDDYSNDIMDLRCVTFNFKKHSEEVVSVGLIAEEVEEILPQLVVKDEEGLPMTVRYLDLIPMLLNEVQKLEKRVKELESQLIKE